MQLKISHTTQYRYDAPVDYALQKLRLRPMASALQDVPEWSVDVQGGKIEASYRDHYGNHVDLVSTDVGAEALVITAHGTVISHETNGIVGKIYGRAPLWHYRQSTDLTASGAGTKALAQIVSAHENALDGLHALSAAVLEKTPYEYGHTNAATTAEQALLIGNGVCQDHAHIFCAAAREAGFPARYISGYLMMNDRTDQDASHAWAEIHVPDLGWVGFDVSNGYSPDERYVRLAVGRDSSDAAPVSGFRMGQADETMEVSLQVQQ